MIKEIILPEISENVESGEISKYLVSKGETVEIDQPLVEMETDKAIVEIPSLYNGKVAELKFQAGDTVRIGEVLLTVETDDSAEDTKTREEKEPISKETGKVEDPKPLTSGGTTAQIPTGMSSSTVSAVQVAASPSVRRFARELGVDITQITGSGTGGRISTDDIKAFTKNVLSSPQRLSEGLPSQRPLPDFSRWGDIEIKPMNKVRRITADGLAYAWTSIPHVTQFDTADITNAEEFRKRNSEKVEAAGGKLTFTSILLKAASVALERFPKFNASVDMESSQIIFKKYYHIGVAVDTERGLLVPVIRDVNHKNLTQLSVELSEIAQRSRDRKIKPDELEGGTFTISNLGGIGGTAFTPIIYPPQVAIIGVSRAKIQPVYEDSEWKPRLILPLTLSYDHRIIDGADAARFLSWIVKALKEPFELIL